MATHSANNGALSGLTKIKMDPEEESRISGLGHKMIRDNRGGAIRKCANKCFM